MSEGQFQVVSKYQPAGDQPTAIEGLVQGVEDGLSHQTLLGVTGSGKTFTMANVIARLGRPAIIMAPNKTLAAQLYGEFKEFFPNNAVEYFVSYYDYYQPEAYVPSSDTFIEKDSSINEEVERLRYSATTSLLSRRDVVVVSTVSCIYGLGAPEEYLNSRVALQVGQHLDRDDHLVLDQAQRLGPDDAAGHQHADAGHVGELERDAQPVGVHHQVLYGLAFGYIQYLKKLRMYGRLAAANLYYIGLALAGHYYIQHPLHLFQRSVPPIVRARHSVAGRATKIAAVGYF